MVSSDSGADSTDDIASSSALMGLDLKREQTVVWTVLYLDKEEGMIIRCFLSEFLKMKYLT